jgi:hypothetical protein
MLIALLVSVFILEHAVPLMSKWRGDILCVWHADELVYIVIAVGRTRRQAWDVHRPIVITAHTILGAPFWWQRQLIVRHSNNIVWQIVVKSSAATESKVC